MSFCIDISYKIDYNLRVMREDKMSQRYGAGHKGNGITVWDRKVEEYGDYKTVAHISADREISYRVKRVSPELKKFVEAIANGPNPSVSTLQPNIKVFTK
jgi:hypothetical protein